MIGVDRLMAAIFGTSQPDYALSSLFVREMG